MFWMQQYCTTIAFSTVSRQGIKPMFYHFSTQRYQQQQPDEWKGFNPLEPRTSGSPSRYPNSSTRISLRKTRMQTLTEGLLECSTNPEAMQQLLKEQQDFILEPILDLEAPLEEDSIFLGQQTVEQRFITYQTEMEERISKAKTGNARMVLKAMMEFVVLHKKQQQDDDDDEQ